MSVYTAIKNSVKPWANTRVGLWTGGLANGILRYKQRDKRVQRLWDAIWRHRVLIFTRGDHHSVHDWVVNVVQLSDSVSCVPDFILQLLTVIPFLQVNCAKAAVSYKNSSLLWNGLRHKKRSLKRQCSPEHRLSSWTDPSHNYSRDIEKKKNHADTSEGQIKDLARTVNLHTFRTEKHEMASLWTLYFRL